MEIFVQIFPKQALKSTIFFIFRKRPKNGQIILFLAISFRKGQMATLKFTHITGTGTVFKN